jgi:hypothetical protein
MVFRREPRSDDFLNVIFDSVDKEPNYENLIDELKEHTTSLGDQVQQLQEVVPFFKARQCGGACQARFLFRCNLFGRYLGLLI